MSFELFFGFDCDFDCDSDFDFDFDFESNFDFLFVGLIWAATATPLCPHVSYIEGNRIGAEGCIALSSSLVHLSHLKELHLGGECF